MSTNSCQSENIHCINFRYSREVGSTQINLPAPASIDAVLQNQKRKISDLANCRYHPDPTWRPHAVVCSRKPLSSSSSSASTSSSASSTQSNPEPSLHYRRRRKKMATSTPKNKAAAPALPAAAAASAGSIISKPARGWLHPDYLFAKDGINYNVRVSIKSINFIQVFNLQCLQYMGCLEVNTSMKVLDLSSRILIPFTIDGAGRRY